MPSTTDVSKLLRRIDEQQAEVVLVATSPLQAYGLLLAAAGACAQTRFKPEEVPGAVGRLVAATLRQNIGSRLACCAADVAVDGTSLRLRLFGKGTVGGDADDSDEDCSPGSQHAALLQKVASELEAKLLGAGIAADGCVAATNTATASSSSWSSWWGAPSLWRPSRSDQGAAPFSTIATIFGRRRLPPSPQPAPAPPASEPEAEGGLTWASFGRLLLRLEDGLTNEERAGGAAAIADTCRREAVFRLSSVQPDEWQVEVPLGDAAEVCSNPLLAAMWTAAVAALADTLMGGVGIGKRVLRSVEVRGCRGCSARFVTETPCLLL